MKYLLLSIVLCTIMLLFNLNRMINPKIIIVKPRVAVAFVGYFRTYNYTAENHYEMFFKMLNQHFDVDVFICGPWDTDDPRPVISSRQDHVSRHYIHTQLSKVSKHIIHVPKAEQSIQQIFQGADVNTRFQHAWMRASECFDAINPRLDRYEWVIKLRPDVAFYYPVPPPHTWNTSAITTTKWHGDYSDHFWIMRPQLARVPFRIIWFWIGLDPKPHGVEDALVRQAIVTNVTYDTREDIGTVVVTLHPRTGELYIVCHRVRMYPKARTKCNQLRLKGFTRKTRTGTNTFTRG